jgi:hypothetical protein
MRISIDSSTNQENNFYLKNLNLNQEVIILILITEDKFIMNIFAG